MAWQVAIVVDQGEPPETLHANLSILLGQMPVWAITKAERVPAASELRKQWQACWEPEPALTLVSPMATIEPAVQVLDLIPTVQEHHPRLSAVRLFGIEASDRLTQVLESLGFMPISGTSWDGLGFAVAIERYVDLPAIQLDAGKWKSRDDLYEAFFAAVGAPDWHGRCLDALNDSIGSGAINAIEVPYKIVVRNSAALAHRAEVSAELNGWQELIRHLQTDGCPVDMVVEP